MENNTATYTIKRFNGSTPRTANSLKDALAVARQMLGVSRVYRGAEYETDRPASDGDRESCTALDIWVSRQMASTQTGQNADVVISWQGVR